MDEVFIDIQWYEWKYKISNYWNVVSKKWIDRKFSHSRDWYSQLSLFKSWIQQWFLIHRLVAIYFIQNPGNKKEVNHINGIKTDNRVENLEWVTHKENIIHSHKYLKRKSSKWIKRSNYQYNWLSWWEHHSSKVVLQYSSLFIFIKRWESATLASKELWIWIFWISKSCNLKIVKSGWFIWRYE
jgi:hypothetical protein